MGKSMILGFSVSQRSIVLFVLVLLAVAAGYLFHWENALFKRYSQDFVGMSEEDVIVEIGEPCFDGRTQRDYTPGSSYTLGWNYGYGNRLGLIMKDGTVIEQWHGSR